MMKNMTAEQAAQRQALIDMGMLAEVVDRFEPHEFGWVLQETLLEDLLGDDDEDCTVCGMSAEDGCTPECDD